MVSYLPLVQQVQDLMLGNIKNFIMKILNLTARRGGDVQLVVARLSIDRVA